MVVILTPLQYQAALLHPLPPGVAVAVLGSSDHETLLIFLTPLLVVIVIPPPSEPEGNRLPVMIPLLMVRGNRHAVVFLTSLPCLSVTTTRRVFLRVGISRGPKARLRVARQ